MSRLVATAWLVQAPGTAAARSTPTHGPTFAHKPPPPNAPASHSSLLLSTPLSTPIGVNRFPEGEWQSYKDDNLWRETMPRVPFFILSTHTILIPTPTPHPHPPTHPPTHQPISTRPLCYTRRFPEGEWQSYKDDNLWRETSAGPDPLLFHTLLQCTLTGDCSPRPSPPPKKTMTCTQVP
jgi:hypothetical protein